MPHVAIANVIGTIGLLVLLSIVVVISTTTSLQSTSQAALIELQEVASYVSNQIVAIGSLTASSQKPNVTAYKILVLPPNLELSGYAINLTSDASGWRVIAYLENNPSISASASLSFAAGINVIIPGTIVGPVTVTEVVHSGEGSSLATATLTAVIVFQSVGGTPYIGIGVSPVGRNL